MQKIEINTSQNVRITYELANLGDRFFAFLIDALVIGGAFLGSMLFAGIFTGNATSWVFYVISFPILAFYTLVSETLMKGQTLGKKALRIQVVKLSGTEPKSSDHFLRWIFRLIDIFLSAGTIAAIFVLTSKKGQRLGDLICETCVIRMKPASQMQFYEMMKNYETDGYEPQFPQVKRLSEAEMLFIQNVILRYQRFKNQAHETVLTQLSDRVRARLDIAHTPAPVSEQINFLRTLIRDYIILTR